MPQYHALISSDWNECLAPCGPCDAIGFSFPKLEAELNAVFRGYTGNRISLGQAAETIAALMPEPMGQRRMDAYLDTSFRTYRGVPELIRWASRNRVLFMINTTGMIGYFQRIFARELLPAVPALAAHPLIRFDEAPTDPATILPLFETTDKAVHTEAIADRFCIPLSRIAVIGDSGGDGPHFAWASKTGATRIGSMTKSSLTAFCDDKEISFDLQFGRIYHPGEATDTKAEMIFDFQDLIPFFEEKLLGRK
jgi:hypothetical protein